MKLIKVIIKSMYILFFSYCLMSDRYLCEDDFPTTSQDVCQFMLMYNNRKNNVEEKNNILLILACIEYLEELKKCQNSSNIPFIQF
ncbi:MAG: hypothetical protein KatS3mg129_2335 [Leptospiraceae bacterium]|nr:MAG: hypothetical protein KatS3mg129_2335 [Leptospiraceae bacterium]